MVEENDLIIEGKLVDYTFLPGEPLVVSHGEYRIANETSLAQTCAILSCHFWDNDKVVPLGVFYVYVGDREFEKVITLPSKSELDIRVTFPYREVHVGINFRYGVQIYLECRDRQYNVTSKLNITQEKF